MGGTLQLVCCSKEKDDIQDDITPTNKPIVYKCLTPYTQPTTQQPLYDESLSQIPLFYSASRAPTLINQ